VTTDTQIGITWTDGLSNGGTTVIDYRIKFDQGSDTWTTLISGVTDK